MVEKNLELKKLEVNKQALQLNVIKQKQHRNILLIVILLFALLLLLFLFYNTKLKAQNKKIKENELALKKSNATIKKTVAIISHDLKEPFNIFVGFSAYILDNFKSITTAELKQYITSINRQATNNLNLTNQLLTWALKQQKGFKIHKNMHSIDATVQKAILGIESSAHQNKIKIKYTPVDLQLNHDKNIVFNVLANILSNAVKNSPKNTTVTIKTYLKNDYFYLQVIDEGFGIPATLLKKLNAKTAIETEKFEFLTESDEYKGGFGLTYVKELVDLYGGTIKFMPNDKEGTTVLVAFLL